MFIINSVLAINMFSSIILSFLPLAIINIVCINAGDSSNLDDPVLFCDGCFALVSEVEKDMSMNKGQKLNTRIEKTLSGVCSTDRLRAYKFSPPTQVKTCNGILGKYTVMLSNILREEYRGGRSSNVETLTRLFCTEVMMSVIMQRIVMVFRVLVLVMVGRFLLYSRGRRGKRQRRRQERRKTRKILWMNFSIPLFYIKYISSYHNIL